jgi:MYXO-CTERM domain-containing protein
MRALLLAASALVVDSRTANACSCASPILTISPQNGSTSVATNAAIIVEGRGADLLIEVQDTATAQSVPLTRETHATYAIATPTGPLNAGTTYSVVVTSMAQQRMVASSTFTTGSTVDMVPPTFAGILSISPETMVYPIPDSGGPGVMCLNSCVVYRDAHVSRIRLEYDDPPPDTALLTLALYGGSDHALIDEMAITHLFGRTLGFGDCGLDSPELADGSDYCAQVVAYDAAGNATGSAIEACANAIACAPEVGADCGPSDACDPPAATEPKRSGCSTSGQDTMAPALLAILAILVARRRRCALQRSEWR